ncbi:hypothetical protein WR25_17788 [Diploscapter pachys]|uniref:F-box domain-containing protein n=1 Tax=Diploscapter pachys TaxID=2018661 RepID=A0A2A2LFB4_9BILA|nr:hypothetical protein WR25_17788 [Diploscapter pachys]
MLSSLPTELLLSILRYLPFKDMEQLVWSDRRLMQIARCHFRLSFSKRKLIHAIDIQPCTVQKNILSLQVTWNLTKYCYHHLAIKSQIRDSRERRRFHKEDEKVFLLLQEYYRYCHLQLNNYVRFIDWKTFARLHGFDEEPIVEMHWLMGRINVQKLLLESMDRYQFWRMLEVIESARTVTQENSIQSYKLQFFECDRKRFQNSLFMKNEIKVFEIKASPLTPELLLVPQYMNAKWTLYDLPSSQFVLLSSLPTERIVVRGGSMSVRQFMQNLLLAAPVKRRWHFSNIRNEDDQLGWDSIGDLLRSNKLIHWTGALLNDMGVRFKVQTHDLSYYQTMHLEIIHNRPDLFELNIY